MTGKTFAQFSVCAQPVIRPVFSKCAELIGVIHIFNAVECSVLLGRAPREFHKGNRTCRELTALEKGNAKAIARRMKTRRRPHRPDIEQRQHHPVVIFATFIARREAAFSADGHSPAFFRFGGALIQISRRRGSAKADKCGSRTGIDDALHQTAHDPSKIIENAPQFPNTLLWKITALANEATAIWASKP